MKIFDQKTIQKLFITFAFVAFFFVGVFGMTNVMGMQINGKGEMAGCIFNNQSGPCPMTLTEHITLMQEMFSVTPGTMGISVILLLASLVFAAFIFEKYLRTLFLGESESRRLYLKQRRRISFLNPLQEAFSQGILNPKIYESVAL